MSKQTSFANDIKEQVALFEKWMSDGYAP